MKTYSTLRNTISVAVLAGAGLAGCAGDPFYDNRGYSSYDQPVVYQSQRYYGTNAQGNYYDPNYPNRTYYTDRPYYYYQSR